MEIFKCYVPRNEYYLVKNMIAVIYERERLKYPELTDSAYDRKIANIVRKRYKEANGAKSVLEILKEYREELRKEGY